MEIFEEIFRQFKAVRDPMCCITQIVDDKPQIDIVTDHSPLKISAQEDFEAGESVMSDYLQEYMTSDGLDFGTLINNDYFEAIRVLFKQGYYVSCMKLIVSFIDTVAFIEYGDTKGNFCLWLDRFAELKRLNITPAQLWELRNSILHMSNLDSRNVLSGKEKRISFCVAKKGFASKASASIQYFNLIDFLHVLGDAVSRWLESLNEDREKFPLFVERYDRVVSDSRMAVGSSKQSARDA